MCEANGDDEGSEEEIEAGTVSQKCKECCQKIAQKERVDECFQREGCKNVDGILYEYVDCLRKIFW